MTKHSKPVPIEALIDLTGDRPSTHETAQRIVRPHPQFPESSIETVWEVFPDKSMRIAVYSGPDSLPRVLHSSFALPPDADPPIADQNLMAWTSFPDDPTHLVLCALINATAVTVWDVYPSAGEEHSSLMLPAEGWTISLPFECCSILAVEQRGLFLQRLEYAEDMQQAVEEDDGFFLKSPPPIANREKGPRHSIAPPPAPPETPSNAVPSLFSLTHPLEDVLPVCQLIAGTIRPITDVYEKLVWMGQAEWVDPTKSYEERKMNTQVLIVTVTDIDKT